MNLDQATKRALYFLWNSIKYVCFVFHPVGSTLISASATSVRTVPFKSYFQLAPSWSPPLPNSTRQHHRADMASEVPKILYLSRYRSYRFYGFSTRFSILSIFVQTIKYPSLQDSTYRSDFQVSFFKIGLYHLVILSWLCLLSDEVYLNFDNNIIFRTYGS